MLFCVLQISAHHLFLQHPAVNLLGGVSLLPPHCGSTVATCISSNRLPLTPNPHFLKANIGSVQIQVLFVHHCLCPRVHSCAGISAQTREKL